MAEILEPGLLGSLLGQSFVGKSGQTYIRKVLGIQSADLIAYWPLNERSGTNADNAEGTAARDGTFARNVTTMGTATGIGDLNTAPAFDGTNDYCDVYSASFSSAFDVDTGSISLWVKPTTDFWAAGDFSMNIITMRADANNLIQLTLGTAASSQLYSIYKANAVDEDQIITTSGETTWIHLAITWDTGADEVRHYYNGAQNGSTDSGLDTWVGALDSARAVIGAASTIPSGQSDAYFAHVAVWTKALVAAEILNLATV